MTASERQGNDLATTNGGGFMRWLKRLVAGAELDALETRIAELTREVDRAREAGDGRDAAQKREAELEQRVKDLDAALSASKLMADELEKLLDERAAATSVSTDGATAQLKDLEQRITELDKSLTKKEAERRDAASKALKLQGTADGAERRARELEAKVREAEAKVREAEAKVKAAERRAEQSVADAAKSSDSVRDLATARTSAAALQKRVAELEASLARASSDARALAASFDQRVQDLERRLVDAMVGPRDDDAVARALEERDALVEELQIALAKQREASSAKRDA